MVAPTLFTNERWQAGSLTCLQFGSLAVVVSGIERSSVAGVVNYIYCIGRISVPAMVLTRRRARGSADYYVLLAILHTIA